MPDNFHERARRLGIQFTYRDANDVEQSIDESIVHALVTALDGANDIPPEHDTFDHANVTNGRAPKAFQPAFVANGDRVWLLAVQLYSLQSSDNWGHGDFGDLARLLTIVAKAGGDGVGLNPLHALFEDRADDGSPYAPSSRRFLNPLYLDMAAIPGSPGQAEKPILSGADVLIDYGTIAAAKYAALREAYRRFAETAPDGIDGAFALYRQHTGETLRRFAIFTILRRRFGERWRDWPALWRDGDEAALERLALEESTEVAFQEFLQWQAHEQLASCRDLAKRLGLRIGLYLDLAVGVHPDGFDAWDQQDVFLKDIVIGAPPDPLNKAGQNWGLTAFNPTALVHHAYQPFREMLAATMQYAGAVRFDHILGLNRLYLIPEGMGGGNGAYVPFPLMDLIGIIARESHRYECLIIGEDLGTVPDGLRETLQQSGIWTFLVTQFARNEHGVFLAPDDYAPRGLATFGTHDLPTLAGWLAGTDLSLLETLNIPAGETKEQRQANRQALMDALDEAQIAPGEIFDRLMRFLAKTPSGVVSISLEDVLGIAEQVNLPGTYREYPNWRHRLPIAFDSLATRLSDVGRILAGEGRSRQPIK